METQTDERSTEGWKWLAKILKYSLDRVDKYNRRLYIPRGSQNMNKSKYVWLDQICDMIESEGYGQ